MNNKAIIKLVSVENAGLNSLPGYSNNLMSRGSLLCFGCPNIIRLPQLRYTGISPALSVS